MLIIIIYIFIMTVLWVVKTWIEKKIKQYKKRENK